MEEVSKFKSYKIISLRDDPPANCLWINGTLRHLPEDYRFGESIRVTLRCPFEGREPQRVSVLRRC